MEGSEIIKPMVNTSIFPSKEERDAISASSQPFLPSIKLVQSLSEEIGTEQAKGGDFYIGSLEINLGNKFIATICSRRSHALLLEGNTKTKESFNYNSPVFKEIMQTPTKYPQTMASASDCDFLIWLPDYDIFVTMFFGRPSMIPTGHEILDIYLPVEERKTKYLKSLPHTNVFEIYSHFETQRWGPKYKSWIPKINPVELKTKEDAVKYWPLKELLTTSEKIFFEPVRNEIEYEKVNDVDVDR